jgi:hypothetical protein
LLSVSRVAPLTLKNKLVNDSGHFYVWTASLIRWSIIEENYCFRKAQNWSYSVTTILGVCALLITGGSYRTKHIKILDTNARGPLDFEALVPSL